MRMQPVGTTRMTLKSWSKIVYISKKKCPVYNYSTYLIKPDARTKVTLDEGKS